MFSVRVFDHYFTLVVVKSFVIRLLLWVKNVSIFKSYFRLESFSSWIERIEKLGHVFSNKFKRWKTTNQSLKSSIPTKLGITLDIIQKLAHHLTRQLLVRRTCHNRTVFYLDCEFTIVCQLKLKLFRLYRLSNFRIRGNNKKITIGLVFLPQSLLFDIFEYSLLYTILVSLRCNRCLSRTELWSDIFGLGNSFLRSLLVVLKNAHCCIFGWKPIWSIWRPQNSFR